MQSTDRPISFKLFAFKRQTNSNLFLRHLSLALTYNGYIPPFSRIADVIALDQYAAQMYNANNL